MQHPSRTLLARNDLFAEGFDRGDLSAIPTKGTIILTCMDSRVDPAAFVGLELGEALVIRNVGGRATDGVLDELRMAGALTAGASVANAVLIVHHTDCGTARFLQPAMQETLASLGAPVDQAAARAVSDPAATVAADVARIRGVVPTTWTVGGYVYDVRTGRLAAV